ncbi:hypothetical protein, partial [Pseudomonas sp. FW305-124]|uniref:hypothetical protein n=1 Tax=Pseudomonas sp. FW305-124 TaxID=2070649 RepID=UPI001C47EC79
AGVPDTFAGMGACWLKLRDVYAPKAVIGFHTSSFGTALPATIAFYKAIGAQHGDFVTTDMLDRDAGCFEAHTDPNCQRTEGG